MTSKIRNWSKFQHFKDRKPPWIKLYRDILDDVDWHELNGNDAKHLVMIWLIASEQCGDLPDIKTLAFRLRLKISDTESLLTRLSNWIVSDGYQDDIKMIQDNSAAEVSEHQETETERETESLSAKPTAVQIPYEEIRAAYNEALANKSMAARLVRSDIVTKKAKTNIQKRWKESEKHRDMRFWKAYFEGIRRIRRFNHLSGGSHGGWRASLEFVTRDDKFFDIINELKDEDVWA